MKTIAPYTLHSMQRDIDSSPSVLVLYGRNSSATTMTTQVYSSSVLPSKLSNHYTLYCLSRPYSMTFCVVDNAVTKTPMISDITFWLLLLLIQMQCYASIHSLNIYFEVNFGPSLCSLFIFHGTMHMIVLTLISILSLVDVYSSYDVYFTSGECVIVPKIGSTPWMDISLNG